MPQGTPVIEYRYVPDGERTDVLRLERDLVLTEAFGRPFYDPAGIAVADDGRIFVLDRGNYRVVAFDASGEALVEFGRQGEGPGELNTPENIAEVRDSVVINDRMGSKLSVYSVDGEHLGDHRLEDRWHADAMLGFGDDLLVVRDAAPRYVQDSEMVPGQLSIGRYSISGDELATMIAVPYVLRAYWGHGPMYGSAPLRAAYVSGAVGPDGAGYFSNGDEYQVLAVGVDGGARFALRTNYVPEPIDQERRRQAATKVIEDFSQFVPDLEEDDFVWPDRHPAIDRLAVDGSGNLYVFPLIFRWLAPEPPPAGPFAVDIYSPSGERLFAGKMPIWRWDAARGDRLYAVETDPETEESVVVRYRVVADFIPETR